VDPFDYDAMLAHAAPGADAAFIPYNTHRWQWILLTMTLCWPTPPLVLMQLPPPPSESVWHGKPSRCALASVSVTINGYIVLVMTHARVLVLVCT
jgi:hypothetical protein